MLWSALRYAGDAVVCFIVTIIGYRIAISALICFDGIFYAKPEKAVDSVLIPMLVKFTIHRKAGKSKYTEDTSPTPGVRRGRAVGGQYMLLFQIPQIHTYRAILP